MRETAKHEERAKHRRELRTRGRALSMTERAKCERERAAHEREG